MVINTQARLLHGSIEKIGEFVYVNFMYGTLNHPNLAKSVHVNTCGMMSIVGVCVSRTSMPGGTMSFVISNISPQRLFMSSSRLEYYIFWMRFESTLLLVPETNIHASKTVIPYLI